jgi:hypothetical protein
MCQLLYRRRGALAGIGQSRRGFHLSLTQPMRELNSWRLVADVAFGQFPIGRGLMAGGRASSNAPS